MRATLAPLLLIATLSGCATKPDGPPPAILPVATCSIQAQCDAMWSEALVQVQNISGMRLQVATESYAQTYGRIGPNRMSANVRKVPQPNGRTAFEAEFSCSGCGYLPYTAVNLFTTNLNVVGGRFEQAAHYEATTK
jgi:hypothetical protein